MISVPFSSLAPMWILIEVPYRSAARAHCLALIMIFRGTSSLKKVLTAWS